MNEINKSLSIGIEAKFNSAPFVQGGREVIESAKAQTTALDALRESTMQTINAQRMMANTRNIYSNQRQEYQAKHNVKKVPSNYLFSEANERVEMEKYRTRFDMESNYASTLLENNPELESSGVASDFRRAVEYGIPKTESELQQLSQIKERAQQAARDRAKISTDQLKYLVNKKLGIISSAPKAERAGLYSEAQPFISSYASKLSADKVSAERSIESEIERMNGLSPAAQVRETDASVKKIQEKEAAIKKLSSAELELAQNTKKATEEAGLASKQIPGYVASVANMTMTIGQGIANISQAGALAFDYGSPIGMYGAQQGFDISRRQMMYSTGGSIVGQIAGAGIGTMTGNPFIGSYLGGMIGGGLGDMIGTLTNTGPKVNLQMMQQMYGKSSGMANQFAQVEGAEYGISRQSGASPSLIAHILSKYRNFAVDNMGAAQLANQYIQSTGRMDESGFDQWMQYYARTGSLPTGGGALSRLTGRDQTSNIAGIGAGAYGFTEARGNIQKLTGLNQFYAANTNVASSLFMNSGDIERSTNMMSGLPFSLFGEGLKSNLWAQSPEGMQQIQRGYSALGQAKNPAEQALLYNALHKPGAKWRDTLTRMQQGVSGKGNLEDILAYVQKFGDKAGDVTWSMLQDKGINPELAQLMANKVESGEAFTSAGLADMKNSFGIGGIGTAKAARSGQIRAGESIDVTEASRGFSSAFLAGMAKFNVEVATLVASPEVQSKIQVMYTQVIESVKDAIVNFGKDKQLGDAADGFKGKSKTAADSVIDATANKWFNSKNEQMITAHAPNGDAFDMKVSIEMVPAHTTAKSPKYSMQKAH